eukprot:COSAG06_NODE_54742_length_293_cov_0.706186_1_plen_48_part_00
MGLFDWVHRVGEFPSPYTSVKYQGVVEVDIIKGYWTDDVMRIDLDFP